jgi:DNA relaxase NicK
MLFEDITTPLGLLMILGGLFALSYAIVNRPVKIAEAKKKNQDCEKEYLELLREIKYAQVLNYFNVIEKVIFFKQKWTGSAAFVTEYYDQLEHEVRTRLNQDMREAATEYF